MKTITNYADSHYGKYPWRHIKFLKRNETVLNVFLFAWQFLSTYMDKNIKIRGHQYTIPENNSFNHVSLR